MDDFVPPIVRTFQMCDHVYVDATSKKFFLMGLIEEFFAKSYPWPSTPPFDVYIALTEITRPIDVSVRIVDINEEHPPVVELPQPVRIDAPSAQFVVTSYLMFRNGIPMPAEGTYKIELLVDGHVITDRPFKMYLRK